MRLEYDAAKLAALVITKRKVANRQGMREAAKEAGVSPAQICKAENQKRIGFKTLAKICNWLAAEKDSLK